ncbi:reticulon-3-like isoform X3 [Thunnus albacares]|uniref:reticulon-3-like isoform X2 n=1 Tax=Thunnus maccoyii TaxID=8240 RepID=UPI001C4BA796|nr:reticulon-3-like isoform X2 [Thunnus maccoyii]XP_044228082.1 reticulon-3-like isoform X3 [Thunnus albacares]
MADSEEQHVSSSSEALFSDVVHHYQAEPEPEQHRPDKDLFSMDDIVDLVGGAQDALERHIAEDEFTETPYSPPEEPVMFQEPVRVTEPEPVSEVKRPEPEREVETIFPDSTSSSIVPPTPLISFEPEVVAPKAEPESAKIVPEPEPAPESDALPAAEPRSAAPSPAEAAQQPAVTEEAPAPASYVPSPSKAQPHPLMQFPTVVDLLYWRDVKTTGVVFGAILLLLLSLTVCSIVSVCSYIGLALLSVTICFRIYKGILQAIQKSDEGHPFKQYLDQEVALSEDMVHKYSDMVLARLNKSIGELRRLFLVEDLVDSIKFAVFMWILTYVGALFNGLTIVILAVVGVFSVPIVYEKHQDKIDHYLALVNNQFKDVVGKIQAKVPGMKRKAE